MSEYKTQVKEIMVTSERLGMLNFQRRLYEMISGEIDKAELQGEEPNWKAIVEKVLRFQ